MNRQKVMQLLIDELVEFGDEFDASDPEWTQILFNKHLSNLIRKRVVRTRNLPRKIRLAEIVELLIDSEKRTDEMMQPAKHFDDIIRSYGDEPDKESMEEARVSLEKVIDELKAALVAQC
jgi:hypothetical protein